MPTIDTFYYSQSGSKFPCTHARVESVYNLDKVNIHKVNIHELALLKQAHSEFVEYVFEIG